MPGTPWFVVTIVIWVICGFAAVKIAESKGHPHPQSWFWAGLLLGPLGLLLAALVAGAPPSAQPPDPTAQIGKLAELRASGAITEAEYEAKKRQLLDRV